MPHDLVERRPFAVFERVRRVPNEDKARDLLSGTLADGGLDQLARRSFRDGRTPSVRWIVVHMIEEYARPNGHADLIRELVDGAVGE